jgi:hypothetical protein
LGDSANRDLKGARKRVLPAAGRAAIAKAAKKRWAKVRSQAKKVAVVATSGEPDCGDYGLGLKRLVSYIQRRLFSGNTPALPAILLLFLTSQPTSRMEWRFQKRKRKYIRYVVQ